MPLLSGTSKEVIEANIAELIRAGHSPEQAAAIAHDHARRRQDDPPAPLGATFREQPHPLAMRRHVHERLGLATQRRRVPQQLRPEAIEREYAKELVGLVEHIELFFQPLLTELPALLNSADAELHGHHIDAGESARAKRMIDQARARYEHWMSDARMRGVIEKYGDRASSFQREQLLRQLRAALGIDALILDRKARKRIADYVEENMAYITDLSASVISGIEKLVMRGLATGQKYEQLAKDIAKRFKIGKGRAANLASDQINMLVGRLNMDRQLELGITKYRWRTRRDNRVRPEHRSREGKIFSWVGKGRAPTIPGEEWGCRCFAEPVLEGVLESYAELVRTTVPPRRPNARPRPRKGDVFDLRPQAGAP